MFARECVKKQTNDSKWQSNTFHPTDDTFMCVFFAHLLIHRLVFVLSDIPLGVTFVIGEMVNHKALNAPTN